MNKKLLIYKTRAIVSVSLFLALFPTLVHGFVLDLGKKQINSLATWAGPFAALFIFSFLFFLAGRILLLISTWLLQQIITISATALTVTGDGAADAVRVGWDFTTGIVNLLLIIAFVVIAFAVILGLEKIQLKKALPRLIIVAILVNFTLLFVGMGIDLSNFLFNTIAIQFMAEGQEVGGNILYNALMPLLNLSDGITNQIILYIIVQTGLLLIPYVAVVTQVGWVVSIVMLLPIITQLIFYGAIMWLLSGVFFLYFVVFLARIFIVQVLAILAPLAFFCLIFDDTKKWWDKWLKALTEWLFVGVIFIFLMYIGLALAPTIKTLAGPVNPPGFLRWLTGDVVGHIVLLVYFIVLIGIAKSFIPAAVNAMISQATAMAKMATPWVGAIAAGTGKGIRNAEAERSERIKNPPPEPTRGFAKFAHNLRGATDPYISKIVGGAHRVAGVNQKQQLAKDEKEKVDKLKEKHGEEFGAAIEEYNSLPDKMKSPSTKAAFLKYVSGGGSEALEKLSPETLQDLLNVTTRRGDLKTAKRVIKYMPDVADVGKAESELIDANASGDEEAIKKAERKLGLARTVRDMFKKEIDNDEDVIDAISDLTTAENDLKSEIDSGSPASVIEAAKKKVDEAKEELERARTSTIHKISAQSLKKEDIEKLSGSALMNESFQKAITQVRGLDFVRLIGNTRSDGVGITEGFNKTMGGITKAEWAKLKKNSPYFCNQVMRSPGAQAMFSILHDRTTNAWTTHAGGYLS